MLRHGAALAAEGGDDWWVIDILQRLADGALDLGRLDEGGTAAREALSLAPGIADRQTTVFTLSLLAREAAARGFGRRAGRIWGGLEAEVERGGPVGQWDLEEDAVREQVASLAGDEFQAGVADGRSLSLDEVITEALGEP